MLDVRGEIYTVVESIHRRTTQTSDAGDVVRHGLLVATYLRMPPLGDLS